MEFVQPRSLPEALAVKAERPEAVPIAGGTDVMVELNFDRRRPEVVLDLTRVPELGSWERSDGGVRVGAGVTYARMVAELAGDLPGLAIAARTVGSPRSATGGPSAGTWDRPRRPGTATRRCWRWGPRSRSPRRRAGPGGSRPIPSLPGRSRAPWSRR